MELHFYPGQKLLVVKDSHNIQHPFDAWGGPSTTGNDPHMKPIPTTAGTYIIASTGPYSTQTWSWSKIKWGTKLKDMPHKKDVWYQLSSGKWGSVKKDIGINRTEIMKRYYELYSKNVVPKKWVFNDFGPIAIRYFKDINGNRMLDKNERLSGEMIHTTPENEAQSQSGNTVTLAESHGCIHVKPKDRNKLHTMGAFKSGTTFIVHKYSERL
ncbi:hypothetical protein PN36_34390 [Candidatus Thiomargarita nelsonii]|uniref:YkuD domain-containing protein n=1 Tax=Candidatus Thiomargarita nelsonii TaxID=1003181 RepID=A0A4E0QR37_9GAMM|nr:hypothetical protein PN36_34390 [Candidatus Thiomargarita nelsonii]